MSASQLPIHAAHSHCCIMFSLQNGLFTCTCVDSQARCHLHLVVSWLCPDITAAEITLPGYSAVRLDRDRHGGAIILFVADILQCESPAIGSVLLRLRISSCVCSVCTINKEQYPNSTWLANRFICVSVHNLNLV